jgi:hypothetical protein
MNKIERYKKYSNSSGSLFVTGTRKNGLEEGTRKRFFENGNIDQVNIWKNGNRIGNQIGFSLKGFFSRLGRYPEIFCSIDNTADRELYFFDSGIVRSETRNFMVSANGKEQILSARANFDFNGEITGEALYYKKGSYLARFYTEGKLQRATRILKAKEDIICFDNNMIMRVTKSGYIHMKYYTTGIPTIRGLAFINGKAKRKKSIK